MARPKTELPPAEAILALADEAGRLAVKVTPGSRSEALEIVEGKLLARIRAQPEDGKANAALIELIAHVLVLAPSRVRLLRGATSREKMLQIEL